jgi:glycosyltransferase involved in cell wall biosynthesis
VHILNRDLPAHGFRSELLYGRATHEEGTLPPPVNAVATELPMLMRSISPRRDALALRALVAFLRDRRPDIVHTHMAKAGSLGRIAAARTGVPTVVHTYHGHVLEGYFSRPFARAIIALERRLARKTDALVAVSPQVRDELLALGIGTPDQWHVIRVGLDLDGFLSTDDGAEEGRAALGLPSSGPIIGIVGRLVPIKDHATFLAAAAIIRAAWRDAIFVVAGDGPLRSTLERAAPPYVRFLGWVDDVPLLYRACDVVVLTSRNEGTPVALIEASAAQTPVVAAKVGGVGDVVADGDTGLLVKAGDAAGFAAAVSELLGDPRCARAMGRRARQRVVSKYTSRRLTLDVCTLYRQLQSDG